MSTYYIGAASLTGSVEQLDRYLYSHTQRVVTITAGESQGTAALLRTDSEARVNAEFLANYQAGRLQSGLWFARTYEHASALIDDEDFLYISDIIATRAGLPAFRLLAGQ